MAGVGTAAGAEAAGAPAPATPRGSGSWRTFLAIFAVAAVAIFATFGVPVLLLDTVSPNTVRYAAVVSLLIGLALSTQLLGPTWLARDLAALAPLLPESVALPDAEDAYGRLPAARRACIALGAALGVAIVFATGERYTLHSVWDAGLYWALLSNATLFGLMVRVAWRQRAEEAFVDREVTSRLRVPLLEREGLFPYARRGLRGSVFWLVGSSIASVLIFNWGFSWVTMIVVLCTLAIGTFSLVDPSRRLRRRIQRAKREELARVRAAIEGARSAALETADAAAAARLPGLLAWETRVAAVHEWPFDVSTWLRFGALALVAVGSWLGGALVERILGLALD